MGRPTKSVKMEEHVAVYFGKEELKQISKKANTAILPISPFLRKHIIETLAIIPSN